MIYINPIISRDFTKFWSEWVGFEPLSFLADPYNCHVQIYPRGSVPTPIYNF